MPRLSDEDLALRKTMITSTDAVVLAGEDRYGRTPFDVWAEKVGTPARFEETIPMRLGHFLEPFILELLGEEQRRTFIPGATVRHPELAQIGASIDGFDDDSIAEAKVVGLGRDREWEESIPDYVLVQVTQAAIVAGKRKIFVGMMHGTRFTSFEIERNDSLASALIETDLSFWEGHVANRIAPEITAAAERSLRSLYPKVKYGMLRAPIEVEEHARVYFQADRIAEMAAQVRDDAEAKIKAAIGEHAGLIGDGWRATWNESRGKVSWKDAFAELGPKGVDLERFRGAPSRSFRCSPLSENTKKILAATFDELLAASLLALPPKGTS